MRRLIKNVSLLALVLSSSAFAIKNHSVYIKGGLGIFQADFYNTYLDQTDVIPENIAQTAQQHGYIGSLALGYKKILIPNYFIGAELSGNLDNHTAAFQSGASNTAFSDQIKIKNHFDLTFVPGLYLNQTISAYLKLGLSYATVRDALTSPAGYTAINTATNADRHLFGFAAGLGMNKTLTDKISLFVEMNYHDYCGINFPNFQNFSATYTHSSHVYSYDMLVGIAYSFI